MKESTTMGFEVSFQTVEAHLNPTIGENIFMLLIICHLKIRNLIIWHLKKPCPPPFWVTGMQESWRMRVQYWHKASIQKQFLHKLWCRFGNDITEMQIWEWYHRDQSGCGSQTPSNHNSSALNQQQSGSWTCCEFPTYPFAIIKLFNDVIWSLYA